MDKVLRFLSGQGLPGRSLTRSPSRVDWGMSASRKVLLTVLAWAATVSLLHLVFNVSPSPFGAGRKASSGTAEAGFRVGFIPVTLHLTCPVTHFINENMTGDGMFEPVRFNGFP